MPKDAKQPDKKKEVKVWAFGQYLRRCRRRSRKRKPSVEAIAGELTRGYDVDVDDTTLRGYEYGWVDKPDPVVLAALARCYRVELACLIAVLSANRKDRNLSELQVEHILRTVKATAHGEAEAATRLEEIKQRLVDIGGELLTMGEPAEAVGQTSDSGKAPSASDPGDRAGRR